MKLKEIIIVESAMKNETEQFSNWMSSLYTQHPAEVPWIWEDGHIESNSSEESARLVANSENANWNESLPSFVTPKSWESLEKHDFSVLFEEFVFDDLSRIPNISYVEFRHDCVIKSFNGLEKQTLLTHLRIDFEIILENKLPALKLIKLAAHNKGLSFSFPVLNDRTLSAKAREFAGIISTYTESLDLAEATEKLHDMDLGELAHL